MPGILLPIKMLLKALRKNKDSIQLLVFMGTWCEDSQDIIPKFYSLTDAAGFSQDKITLIGVDRKKTTLSHLTEALGISQCTHDHGNEKWKRSGSCSGIW